MKVTLDFVTNSSTSSFTVGVHGELTKEKVLEAFGVPESSALYQLAKDLADLIATEAEECTKEDILEDSGELSDTEEQIFDAGMKCYQGWAASDGKALEQMLCYIVFYHESDDLILDAGGGY